MLKLLIFAALVACLAITATDALWISDLNNELSEAEVKALEARAARYSRLPNIILLPMYSILQLQSTVLII